MIRDGIFYAVAFAAAGAFVSWLAGPWPAVPFLLVGAFCAWFFRDPERALPVGPVALSPADGRVVSVVSESGRRTRISIFLNIFDVHVTRAPVGGRVAAMRYTKGRFVNASLDKASEDNERLAIRIAPPEGPDVAFVLVAGLVARRIVCNLYDGQQVATGQRVGIIRFGSRVDIYCPPPYVPMVVAGQRMVGGETVIADRFAEESPRRGVAQ